MYKITRADGKIVITDWKGQIIYSADNDSILLHETVSGVKAVTRLDKMSDEQLLLALSKAVRLEL